MIAITFNDKYTRYYNQEEDYYYIYEDIVRYINPNIKLSTIDDETHQQASNISSWCDLATIGEEYSDNTTEQYNLKIKCVAETKELDDIEAEY